MSATTTTTTTAADALAPESSNKFAGFVRAVFLIPVPKPENIQASDAVQSFLDKYINKHIDVENSETGHFVQISPYGVVVIDSVKTPEGLSDGGLFPVPERFVMCTKQLGESPSISFSDLLRKKKPEDDVPEKGKGVVKNDPDLD